MSDTPFFSVLIVNFNGGAYVQDALQSLKRQTFRDFEVILIDNASSDGSIDTLNTDGLPAFKLMAEHTHHGFARANKLGAAAARGDWLALLNPDAEAAEDWLEKIHKGLMRYPIVTRVASAQIAMHDPSRLDGAGDNYLVFGIPWRGGYRRPISDLPREGTCFSPCGAAAAYERETFLRACGYDERLFCFCEDVDLGFRLRLAGERCVLLPDAQVAHAGGGLPDKVSGFAVRYGTRNRLWVYLKTMPLLPLLITLPGHLLLTLAIVLRGTMTGRAGAALLGLRDAFAGLGPVLAERRTIQSARKARVRDVIKAMVWNPLAMLGRKTAVREFKT